MKSDDDHIYNIFYRSQRSQVSGVCTHIVGGDEFGLCVKNADFNAKKNNNYKRSGDKKFKMTCNNHDNFVRLLLGIIYYKLM